MATHNGLNAKAVDNGTFEALLRSLEEPRKPVPPPSAAKREAKGPTPIRQPEPARIVRNEAAPPARSEAAPVIRSYYARSVEAALAQAQAELGPDAVLVQSRRTPIELRHLGPYELIFTFDAEAVAAQRSATHVARVESSERRGAVNSRHAADETHAMQNATAPLSDELAQLRAQVEEIRQAVVAPRRTTGAKGAKALSSGAANTIAAARDLLIDAGFDRALAEELAAAATPEFIRLEQDTRGASKSNTALPSGVIWGALRDEIAARLPQTYAPRPRLAQASVIALAGPPGVGKSTALVKLALMRGANAARPVHLISADSYRIGATEQMKTYAAILGADIDFADTPRGIAQAIEANRSAELILIDTPGLSGSNFELLDELTRYLSRQAEIERHLVLNATMRARDLARAIQQYESFAPDALLFTHLDETDGFGALCGASIKSGKSISLLSAGQQIPEDLEQATHERIVTLVCGAARIANESKQ